MADFQDRVMGLTGLTIDGSSTAPSRAEFSQFLNDGVIDVTNRHLALRPLDDHLFLAVSDEQTSQGLDLDGARITSVIRESGTNNDWRVCSEIHSSRQGQVVATGSIYLATALNPVFTILDNGSVSVFPAPGSDPNAFKVYYVNNSPAETDGTALDYASTGIKYFPNDKVYLVVLYAGMKSLQSKMGATIITDISVTVAPPDVPDSPNISSPGISTVTIGSLGTVPTLTSTTPTTRVSFEDFFNTVEDGSPFGDNDPSEFSVTAVPPDALDVPELSSVGTAPDYTKPTLSNDVQSAITTFIDTDEDVELAGAKIQQFQASLAEYQADIQNELNVFNKENVEFQATIQRETQEDSLILQKYQADLATYQAEVQEYTQKLQRYSAEMGIAQQAWAKTESDSLQQYQLDIQANMNEFNEDNVIYQSTIQEAIQNATIAAQEAQKEGDLTLQASIQDYTLQLQKYQLEYSGYTAEVASQIQEYTQNLQADGIGYQWLQGQYAALKAEYDTAFMIAAPKTQLQSGR